MIGGCLSGERFSGVWIAVKLPHEIYAAHDVVDGDADGMNTSQIPLHQAGEKLLCLVNFFRDGPPCKLREIDGADCLVEDLRGIPSFLRCREARSKEAANDLLHENAAVIGLVLVADKSGETLKFWRSSGESRRERTQTLPQSILGLSATRCASRSDRRKRLSTNLQSVLNALKYLPVRQEGMIGKCTIEPGIKRQLFDFRGIVRRNDIDDSGNVGALHTLPDFHL
jgi:hypothetical protein